MKYTKYLFRFLLIVGLVVFTLTGLSSGIKNMVEKPTDVVVTDKYTNQYRGTITNYIDVCRKTDSLCTTISVRNLDDYGVGSHYTFTLSNARFMADGYIFYWATSFSILFVFLAFLIIYFIIWCFEDQETCS